jgi:PIN domain nuclease of toxin-antitoxin system
MRLLLDTHVLLWLMNSDERLTAPARARIVGADAVYVSSATIWEIAIKWSIGKIEENPQVVAERLEQAGLNELNVTHRHALAASRLPLLHRDPFDRMLVAQAMTEPLHLLTADARLKAYSELVVTV